MRKDNSTVCICRVIALSFCRGRAYDNTIVRQFPFLSCYRIVVLRGRLCDRGMLSYNLAVGGDSSIYDRVEAMASLSHHR